MTLKNVLNEILQVQCKTYNDVITFYKLTGILASVSLSAYKRYDLILVNWVLDHTAY